MLRVARLSGAVILCVFLMVTGLSPVAAADGPDMSKFGYPTVAAKMDLTPTQDATITAGSNSVAIKAGTFDNPVTFELLTATPAMWQGQVSGRTVRAGFAFRVTDKTTNTILAAFKQPVVYTYNGKDATSTDVILNTTPATPPVISVNGTPITFDTALHHSFGGTTVGWLVASAAPATAGSPAAVATGAGGASTVRTGTAAPATVLPPTGQSTTSSLMPLTLLALTLAVAMLCAGALVRQQRSTGRPPTGG